MPFTHYDLNQMQRVADKMRQFVDVAEEYAERQDWLHYHSEGRECWRCIANDLTLVLDSHQLLIEAARREADRAQQEARGVAA